MSEIDEMRFLDALRMAEFWVIEPPFSYLYYRSHFQQADEEKPGAMQPILQGVPYAQLSEGLKESVRKTWLRRNPGKTEADFFKAQKDNVFKKYQQKLEDARKAK